MLNTYKRRRMVNVWSGAVCQTRVCPLWQTGHLFDKLRKLLVIGLHKPFVARRFMTILEFFLERFSKSSICSMRTKEITASGLFICRKTDAIPHHTV
ncbi:hypothetical protein CW304_22170 [Bacillus sp. UFRGS-B20]|nr:hypothetical protein CW304_22170 [Bacillus sp. UFRGS-B20]